MFRLSADEWANLKSHSVTSSWGGIRKLPHAFTEQGGHAVQCAAQRKGGIRQLMTLPEPKKRGIGLLAKE